jgi:hypothetical protein
MLVGGRGLLVSSPVICSASSAAAIKTRPSCRAWATLSSLLRLLIGRWDGERGEPRDLAIGKARGRHNTCFVELDMFSELR